MIIFQDLEEGAELGAAISEEKTLSVIDLIVNGGTGSVVIIHGTFCTSYLLRNVHLL